MNYHLAPDGETRVFASLPMYDFPQLRWATDAFWHAISTHLQDAGLGAPATLTRPDDYLAGCGDPGLLLSQACGYPLLKQFKGAMQIVATPIYGLPGCQGLEHRSFFIVNGKAGYRNLSDLRGQVCAVNGFDSNTGMNLLRAAIAPLAGRKAFFRTVNVTGSHFKSLEAVAAGRADIAAIDCVSFAHFESFEPELTGRVVKIRDSQSAAAPPFITSNKTDAAGLTILRKALSGVVSDPDLVSVRSALGIEGFVFETEALYEKLLHLEAEAEELGYPELR